MTEESCESVHLLIREAYRPFRDAAELVSSFARVALTATRSSRASVSLHRAADVLGVVRIVQERARVPEAARPRRELFFPIVYQDTELGDLSLLPLETPLDSQRAEACRVIAKTLAYHLKRHEVRKLARELYGWELGLIGTSASLQAIDRFVERASPGLLPSLILGDAGSEAGCVALALHLAGPFREGPFVCVNCATFEASRFDQQWLSLVSQADGGTLLLNRIEELERPLQHRLCEILEFGRENWTQARSGGRGTLRLVATASSQLEEIVGGGGFYKALLDQLDFLRLEIEPLKSRREDLKPLLEHYLRIHSCGQVVEISEEVLEVCSIYPWPGNVTELSRIVSRLAVMAEDGCVRLHHIERYAPQILRTVEAPCAPSRRPEPESPESLPAKGRDSRHPSLQRAMDYINENYQAKLSLAEVAASAYLSVSHLEHLFRLELGTTFTRFLTRLRIRRAQRLLIDRPHTSVTTIAGDVGFNDLRHFERMFKSLAGCTPRAFRRQAREGVSPQDPPDCP